MRIIINTVVVSLMALRALLLRVEGLSAPVKNVVAPSFSPATGLKNEFYSWRGQRIRYQVTGPEDADQFVLLVHGLFVNSDHWRKTLKGLEDLGNVRAYAIDLLGNGYSSKPKRDSIEAQSLNGENGRFDEVQNLSVLKDVNLGTANGGSRIADVDLRHPLGSCYNFYTWAELCQDFAQQLILKGRNDKKCAIVCNSIGTMTSFQAVTDRPDLFNGVFVVNPNFRELHSAEVPFPSLSMPAVRFVQKLLREKGHPLFNALATPSTVKQILMEPYAVTDAVDDELVDVLLSPLLSEGAADVVFDTLSYSAGPLPEQLLSDSNFPNTTPVWICYGTKDPWTPGTRVENMIKFGQAVEKVIKLEGAGHCPHDEMPHLVNPLLEEFLSSISIRNGAKAEENNMCL